MFRRIIKPLVWFYCWLVYGRRRKSATVGWSVIYFEPNDEYREVVQKWLITNKTPTGNQGTFLCGSGSSRG